MVEAAKHSKVKLLVVGNVQGEIVKLTQLVKNIQSKKGDFDLLLCAGKFFPNKVYDMEELRKEVLSARGAKMDIETYFTDSSDLAGPLMNSAQGKDGVALMKRLNFLGRSGIRVVKGLRIAYVSGIDADQLGPEILKADAQSHYLGNYFVRQDIERVLQQYHDLVKESSQVGVDILLTGQWPLNISCAVDDPNGDLEAQRM